MKNKIMKFLGKIGNFIIDSMIKVMNNIGAIFVALFMLIPLWFFIVFGVAVNEAIDRNDQRIADLHTKIHESEPLVCSGNGVKYLVDDYTVVKSKYIHKDGTEMLFLYTNCE